MVSDLYSGVLKLVIVERVFLFSFHEALPVNCFTGGVYFFGVGSVALSPLVMFFWHYVFWKTLDFLLALFLTGS